MAGMKGNHSIKIERNIIEKYIMVIKDFIKSNSRPVVIISVGLLLVAAVSVSLFVYIESTSAKNLIKYEAIVDKYRMNPEDRGVKDKTISDLRGVITSTKFGYAHQMSYYMLGNLLFEDEKYGEAYDMFASFIKKSSSDEIFIPIAVIKSSVCLEEQGKIDDALNMLVKYADDNNDVINMDQVLFNIGRLYSIKGDKVKSKEFYNRVLMTYPESAFSERSKERLFLLGAVK